MTRTTPAALRAHMQQWAKRNPVWHLESGDIIEQYLSAADRDGYAEADFERLEVDLFEVIELVDHYHDGTEQPPAGTFGTPVIRQSDLSPVRDCRGRFTGTYRLQAAALALRADIAATQAEPLPVWPLALVNAVVFLTIVIFQ